VVDELAVTRVVVAGVSKMDYVKRRTQGLPLVGVVVVEKVATAQEGTGYILVVDDYLNKMGGTIDIRKKAR
jgi:hypothetical protein